MLVRVSRVSKLAAVSLAFALTLLVVTGCSNSAEPEAGYDSSRAAERLAMYIDNDKPKGYVGVETGVREMTIYWHGDRPAALTSVADDIRSHGFSVTIVKAKYSSAQLEAVRRQIEDGADDWADEGFEIQETKIDSRGSAVFVFVDDDADIDTAQSFADDRYDIKVKVMGITDAEE